MIALQLSFSVPWTIRDNARGQAEPPVLVDCSYFLHHVVVEPVEAHQKSSSAWRLTKKPPFCKSILLEEAVVECADRVLLCLIVPVKRPQVEIRRADKLCVVCVVASEDIVDDDLTAYQCV